MPRSGRQRTTRWRLRDSTDGPGRRQAWKNRTWKRKSRSAKSSKNFRVVWVAERLQDGKWTARYCWQHGTSHAAGKVLQEAVLNGKSRRLLGQFDTEADTIAAIKEAVLLEAKWVPPRA